MKKILFLFSVVLILVVLLGADIRREKQAVAAVPTETMIPCKGYTIIEFGKGINCDGDTVRLVKVQGGGQELAIKSAALTPDR